MADVIDTSEFRNGLKIPISEIDGLVAALPGVEQCAGYGVRDDTTGERLAMANHCRASARYGEAIELAEAALGDAEASRRPDLSIRARGLLGVGYSGRTYAERWVVIDTKVLREWDAHDRLRFHCNSERPTVDCPTPRLTPQVPI